MVFGRGRKAKQEQPTGADTDQNAVATEAAGDAAATPAGNVAETAGRAATGPFDVSEIDDQDGYVDLGALLIAPRGGTPAPLGG